MEDLQQGHKIDYSVVVPVYNGAVSLDELCQKIMTFFNSTKYTYEIIFVDDRSKDHSWELIKKIHAENPSVVRGIRLSRNFGQHNATCSGFKAAKGNFIVTMDDDLESSPEDIQLLIDHQKKNNSDLVYGNYINPDKAIARKFFKAIYRSIAKIVEGKARVNGSSFRLVKSGLAKQVESQATHFVFIDEAFLWYTEEIEFVDVKHHSSRRGNSNYSLFGLFKLTGEVVLYSSILPLKLVKYVGFIFAMINMLIGVYYLYKKFAHGFAIPGYASIIISVLFSTGVIMFVLGVIGEYLGKMFRIMNNRPVYSVDEKI